MEPSKVCFQRTFKIMQDLNESARSLAPHALFFLLACALFQHTEPALAAASLPRSNLLV